VVIAGTLIDALQIVRLCYPELKVTLSRCYSLQGIPYSRTINIIFMTQRAAIAMHLLKGETLTIMEGYKLFACSNLPRELSRSIEQIFNVN